MGRGRVKAGKGDREVGFSFGVRSVWELCFSFAEFWWLVGETMLGMIEFAVGLEGGDALLDDEVAGKHCDEARRHLTFSRGSSGERSRAIPPLSPDELPQASQSAYARWRSERSRTPPDAPSEPAEVSREASLNSSREKSLNSSTQPSPGTRSEEASGHAPLRANWNRLNLPARHTPSGAASWLSPRDTSAIGKSPRDALREGPLCVIRRNDMQRYLAKGHNTAIITRAFHLWQMSMFCGAIHQQAQAMLAQQIAQVTPRLQEEESFQPHEESLSHVSEGGSGEDMYGREDLDTSDASTPGRISGGDFSSRDRDRAFSPPDRTWSSPAGANMFSGAMQRDDVGALLTPRSWGEDTDESISLARKGLSPGGKVPTPPRSAGRPQDVGLLVTPRSPRSSGASSGTSEGQGAAGGEALRTPPPPTHEDVRAPAGLASAGSAASSIKRGKRGGKAAGKTPKSGGRVCDVSTDSERDASLFLLSPEIAVDGPSPQLAPQRLAEGLGACPPIGEGSEIQRRLLQASHESQQHDQP